MLKILLFENISEFLQFPGAHSLNFISVLHLQLLS